MNIILETKFGSHLYGLDTPNSDYYNYMYMFADKRWGIIYRHDRSEDIYALLTRVFTNKHQKHEPTEFKEQYFSLLKRLNPLN